MKTSAFLWVSILASIVGVYTIDFPALDVLKPKTSAETQAATATAMVQRVIGARSNEFIMKVDPSLAVKGKDAFKIESVGSQVQVTGSTGVATAMGFYYYLKFHCNSMFTWGGESINLPSTLPPVATPVVITTLDRFRYYQNVCTVSYSSAFWDWDRWERHLDWMAMNGINLPLAFTGQEAIFQRLYMEMGFSQQDMDEFFGGPAFLAWARMGNIQGWGGPLPQTWITKKLVLQHKILDRMRDFGMIPVLPAFAGHVPAAITRVFPQAKVSRLGSWNAFNETYSSTYLLDFDDPLFEKIGSQLIKLMESEFGVDHIYNGDMFNEMTPKSNSTEYLSSAGKAVFNAMQKADPDAVWLMQGWLFVSAGFWKSAQIDALVNSVPRGRMVILDLYSEMVPVFVRAKSYFGQPFIWCMLHNFGGTSEMYGALDLVNDGPAYGRKFTDNSTMVGLGLTMEGIFQNEVVYEFMMENAYTPTPRDITQWISSYAMKRYNFTSSEIDTAWQLLKASVYNCTNGHHDFNYVLITKRPQLKYNINSDMWYDPAMVYKAWDNLLAGADQFKPTELFLYDLVDVTRQSLEVLAVTYYTQIVDAYQSKNTTALSIAGKSMVGLLSDMETLLASDRHFLLGVWQNDAIEYADGFSESFLLQNNARNQITIWGPNGEIVDYAAKQWSGLFKDYYVPRWQFFINWLDQLIVNGTTFNSKTFNTHIFQQVELPFSLAMDLYPTKPTGDTVSIVKQLHQKYRPAFDGGFYRNLMAKSGPAQDFSGLPIGLSSYRDNHVLKSVVRFGMDELR